ncbi:hypothetical protein [Polyangium aurulentum]|uniref:hypothetical protein n=1 Tax=Polyangium aurulentum TaxID=2567896 RepID=UPI0010AE832C|nr:hypothetical protein [Polyangium aurulentum]UQA54946.1 hypothetical protein E8A73_026685 [Polyangium aurulentum]
MRTEVRIHFYAQHIPGGPQSVLGPAGIGPEAAVVREYTLIGKRQVPVSVTLAEDNERIQALFDLLRKHGEDWSEHHADRFTDDELDNARLLLMWPNGECEIDGGI